MAFASIISIIGSLTERLDKIADIRFRIHYIEAHGLSPFETQYGLVTFIILRFFMRKPCSHRPRDGSPTNAHMAEKLA